MSIGGRLRKGEGPFWRNAKSAAKWILTWHVPVAGPSKVLFSGGYKIHVGVREFLAWVLRFFYFEPLFRSRCASVGSGLYMERLPYMQGAGVIRLGDNVRLSGKSTFGFSQRHTNDPTLMIGNDVFIGHGCAFDIAERIEIGDHCFVASGVRMADFDGHPLDAAARRRHQPTPAESVRPIKIGNDVWIGEGAAILKGVELGDRVIVGTRAVVTRSVPADSIVAGNPARVIRGPAQVQR